MPGWPEERRFLRLISATVASKNFEKVKEEYKNTPITNERQQTRMDVLDWNKEQHCPNCVQINPEIEKWRSPWRRGGQVSLKAPEAMRTAGSSQEEEVEAKHSTSAARSSEEMSHHVQDQRGGRALHVVFSARRPRWLAEARRRRRRPRRSLRACVCVPFFDNVCVWLGLREKS